MTRFEEILTERGLYGKAPNWLITDLISVAEQVELELKGETPTEQPDLPAENTVMWWLCRIADDEVRRKAVRNCVKARWHLREESANESIKCAFNWMDTEDGVIYWGQVACSEIPLLPSPEFKEYLELKKKP